MFPGRLPGPIITPGTIRRIYWNILIEMCKLLGRWFFIASLSDAGESVLSRKGARDPEPGDTSVG